ncbi:MAG TPA: hypothetical protein VED40_12590, partial [Azospirillaceae bacterium]|nr:hypothetical protein [Azospirillaceae bacterium]
PAAQPQARPQQAAPAAAAQGAPRPPAKPAAALAEWEIAPQVFSDGSFKLCAAENKFDNGLFLILMANADKRLNIMIAKQGGGFPPGQRFPVKLRIDGKSKIERERGAMTASPEVIMTGVGDDQEFVKGLGTGSALFVEIPGDTAAFQLKGTAKMTADLMGCVDKAKAGQLQLPPPPPAMPPQLANILVQAGLKDARAIPVDKLAPEQRPGDFAWQLGDKIVGAVRYFRPPAEAGDLTKLSQEFVDSLGKSCQGTYTPALKAVENLPQVELRTGSAGCVQKEGGNVHVAMLMYKAKDGTFAVFTHEATDAEKAKAEEASAGIAKVLRELAKKPPEQPQGQAGQQAPAAAAPKKQ